MSLDSTKRPYLGKSSDPIRLTHLSLHLESVLRISMGSKWFENSKRLLIIKLDSMNFKKSLSWKSRIILLPCWSSIKQFKIMFKTNSNQPMKSILKRDPGNLIYFLTTQCLSSKWLVLQKEQSSNESLNMG